MDEGAGAVPKATDKRSRRRRNKLIDDLSAGSSKGVGHSGNGFAPAVATPGESEVAGVAVEEYPPLHPE
jgi:hypothetical protein